MCVIVYKPNDINLKYKHLKKMWDSNSHGAGFAIPLGEGKTQISKGYMTLGELWEALQPVMNRTLVIHFRLATHGGTTQAMTHPFILTDNLEECTLVNTITDKPVLAHNGVISQFGNKEISDTADFILKIASKIPDTLALKWVLSETGSKYALIKDNKVHLVGTFQTYKGMQVSNTFFSYSFATTGFSSAKKTTLDTHTPKAVCTNEDMPKLLHAKDKLWDDNYDYNHGLNGMSFEGIDLDTLDTNTLDALESGQITMEELEAVRAIESGDFSLAEIEEFHDTFGYYPRGLKPSL